MALWLILKPWMMWRIMNNPLRGEIWWVNFDPTVGAEITKRRTAVVISQDCIGRLPLRIVVPITGWDSKYVTLPWMVHLNASLGNGLTKESTADTFQIKSVSINRFSSKLGKLSQGELEEICAAIQICIGSI
jgi:mRNA interferase MazF